MYGLFHFAADTQANLNAENSQQIGTFNRGDQSRVIVQDVSLSSELSAVPLRVPTKYTFGLGFGEAKKWFVVPNINSKKKLCCQMLSSLEKM